MPFFWVMSGRERLAGGALAQHAVAAGAALEIDLLRLLELGLRHRRRAGRHQDLRALGASRGGRALVLQFRDRGRMLGRRISLLRRRGRLGPHRGHLRGGDGSAGVSPGVHREGERVGYLLVGQLDHRRHDRVELDAIDDHLALQAVHDHADRAVLVAEQVVRAGKRRERPGQALAIRLVAGHADCVEDLPALVDPGGASSRSSDLGLVDLW